LEGRGREGGEEGGATNQVEKRIGGWFTVLLGVRFTLLLGMNASTLPAPATKAEFLAQFSSVPDGRGGRRKAQKRMKALRQRLSGKPGTRVTVVTGGVRK
jgi:hypothetical protein